MKLQITLISIALYLLSDDRIVDAHIGCKKNPDFVKESRNTIQSRKCIHASRKSQCESDLDILGIPSTLYSLAAVEDESNPNYWEYSDKNWADRFPLCGGRKQSPIRITNDNVVVVKDGLCLKWLNYHSGHPNLTLDNNGHTLVVSSSFEDGAVPILQGGLLQGTYKFSSLHFHWGDSRAYGAEHIIQGVTLPLEIHAIHYKSEFDSVNAAIASNDPEALVVVAILFKTAQISMPGITVITRAMRGAKHRGVHDNIFPLDHLGYNFNSGYYTYQGSLTTPPCNEIVRWIILEKALPIREDDLALFSKMLVNGRRLVNNFRPSQALNSRVVNWVQSCKDRARRINLKF